MKIAVFGACREGIDVYRSLKASTILTDKKVEFLFLDNDSRLVDSKLEGIKIFKPEKFDLTQLDKIVVGIINFNSVFLQLKKLGVDSEKIIRFYSSDYFDDKERNIGMAKIGKYSYFKPSTILYNVQIGNYCHIGADCRLGLIGHNSNSLTTYPILYQFGKQADDNDASKDETIDIKKINPLKIMHDVYIGEGVTIMSGLTIGIGAVIGSKSVVTKDVEPFSIYAGVPAKRISLRLSQSDQDRLINSKWWELEPEEAYKTISV